MHQEGHSPTTALLALGVALGLSLGCSEEAPPEVVEEKSAPEPVAPVSAIATPLNYEWLDLLYEMEGEVESLETALAKYLEFHDSYEFDGFLDIDPATADKDVLFYLYHFSKNRYFTAEREALVALLARRVAAEEDDPYWAFDAGVRQTVEERLTAATLYREQRIGDLNAVVEVYRKSQDAEFIVPLDVADDELARLRELVTGVMAMERKQVGLLDGRIRELSAKLDGR